MKVRGISVAEGGRKTSPWRVRERERRGDERKGEKQVPRGETSSKKKQIESRKWLRSESGRSFWGWYPI